MPQPEIVFRHGSCSAAIFAKKMERGESVFVVRSVVLQKTYRDADGQWQNTNSFQVNDIPKAVICLNKCYEYLTSNGGCMGSVNGRNHVQEGGV